jgi:ribose 5-phosphate isomerase A
VNRIVKKAKNSVAVRAVDDFVQDGMTIGIGTGNTTFFVVKRLGELVASGTLKDISVVPLNKVTEKHCQQANLPIRLMDDVTMDDPIDVLINSADEVDAQLNLLKGSKGSLVRERMMWSASLQRVVVVSNEDKLVKRLGLSAPLSCEVVPWGCEFVRGNIASSPGMKNSRVVQRYGTVTTPFPDGLRPAVTENGNYVLDIFFDSPIQDAHQLDMELASLPGLVSHGLFVGLATTVSAAQPYCLLLFTLTPHAHPHPHPHPHSSSSPLFSHPHPHAANARRSFALAGPKQTS